MWWERAYEHPVVDALYETARQATNPFHEDGEHATASYKFYNPENLENLAEPVDNVVLDLNVGFEPFHEEAHIAVVYLDTSPERAEALRDVYGENGFEKRWNRSKELFVDLHTYLDTLDLFTFCLDEEIDMYLPDHFYSTLDEVVDSVEMGEHSDRFDPEQLQQELTQSLPQITEPLHVQEELFHTQRDEDFAVVEQGEALPGRTVFATFDDGYRSITDAPVAPPKVVYELQQHAAQH